ncbi:MAG TPA: type II toxin-antitoxin system Phd/YefM family antitoxin [Rhodanobacteraceae bacterium]|nr:type II toxin-antitoxin system Phd/YefM family antitoxin [Rhodanobacteraceae bacterium]
MHETVTLTELRQRLFKLADRVIESGEPLVIERHGVRLRLVREDVDDRAGGRLAKIRSRKQSVVVGPPLDPHESPAQWSGQALAKVAEPAEPAWQAKRRSGRRPRS